jgi:ABC-type Fe3+-hydroxamate transport system substrate-binding protein
MVAYLASMRVVSLCPSLTELVFALGRGSDLVGRTKFCVHPVGAVDDVEAVGGTKNPKLERIFDLAPDLVLLNEEENRREDALALAAAGVPCHVSFPRDVAATADMVRSIGAALDRAEAADAIARDIEQRAARVAAAARNAPEVRFAYLIWHEPWRAAGGDTFISALLSLPGGRNVLAHRSERYPTVIPAELAAANPDVVFLASEPFPFAPRHVDELAAVTGLERDRLRLVDGELLSWHGSRTPHGIDYAEAVMAPVRPGRP